MKPIPLLYRIMFVLLFIPVFGAFNTILGDEAGVPSEPEILLPPVILKLEDLSVESIQSPLPAENVLPPDIQFPLPEAKDLSIEEPELWLEAPKIGLLPVYKEKARNIQTQAVLGIGTLNNFSSNISLYAMGKNPEGKLLYDHESYDGFSSHPPGKGYNQRSDRIEGNVSLDINTANINTEGDFEEIEHGLQEKGNYYSKINRFVKINELVSYKPRGKLNSLELRGGLRGTYANQLLAGGGAVPLHMYEYTIIPSLQMEYGLKWGSFGINGMYGYRSTPDTTSNSYNRMDLEGYLHADISRISHLDTGVGWYWSDGTSHRIPFHVNLLLEANDFLTFSFGGGYKAITHDFNEIFSLYPYANYPDNLVDSMSWWGKAGIQCIPEEKWALSGQVGVESEDAMIDFDETRDITTGLFPVIQKKSTFFSIEANARWIMSDIFTARFKLKQLVGEIPTFVPVTNLDITVDSLGKNGKLGGSVDTQFLSGMPHQNGIPVVSISGFYRVKEFLQFSAEIDDMLSPLMKDPRFSWYPFVDKGFLIRLKTNITF